MPEFDVTDLTFQIFDTLLQRLDDAHGGGAHLAYVGAQFRAVALLLRQGSHPATIERRLFAALAELGQLAGWMAFDAGQHGLAKGDPVRDVGREHEDVRVGGAHPRQHRRPGRPPPSQRGPRAAAQPHRERAPGWERRSSFCRWAFCSSWPASPGAGSGDGHVVAALPSLPAR